MNKKDILITDQFVFFYHGWLSQWYPSKFVVGNTIYTCAEQFMMAEKAKLFKDEYAREQIMNTDKPSEHKKWGRKVSNFDKKIWDSCAKEIVFMGNLAKFSQDKKLMDKLISTGNRCLVEASPVDIIWGIGLDIDDPNITDCTKWKGTNWLGLAITKVRRVLTYKCYV